MTNQEWLDEIKCAWTVIRDEHPEYPILVHKLEKALVQLRTMLKEPTSEEQTEMIGHLIYAHDLTTGGIRYKDCPMCRKIRAAIMARRSVTREWLSDFVVEVIKATSAREVIEEKLAELGLEVKK